MYGYCRDCFSGVFLPSHDETHHLRAWFFATELIPGYHRNIHPLTPALTEGTLLAVMLHDTGMAETTDVTHGLAGRRKAEEFFRRTTLPSLAPAILEAIEKHDDKSYTSHIPRNTEPGIILSLLSLADDMDAFGATGVFRYYEIYLLRGIPVTELGGRVLPNLDHRFHTMAARLKSWPAILKEQEKRYRYTRRFYEDLQTDHAGAGEVTRLFERFILRPRHKPGEALPEILANAGTDYAQDFFTVMQQELSSYTVQPDKLR